MLKKEKIYIAGPECFYTGGYDMLAEMRKASEARGFGVTLPNDHPLDLDNPDLQKRADSIFADLDVVMKDSTAILADLEAYRGSEADSGTIYEIGMAYALGLRCYGYTRDKRPLAAKDQQYVMRDGRVYNERGELAPYKELPFSPCVVGSTKIVEGDYKDCLAMMMTDIEEEQKYKARRGMSVDHGACRTIKDNERPIVYLADCVRYREDAKERYERMKKLCSQYGFDAYSPLDWAPGVTKLDSDCPYTIAANLFDNYQQHVRNCDILIGDLNDYRGYECSNDVGFECGMGFELGKKLYGYLKDARPMIERIPHLGADREYRDMTGANVENFNYPMNLMFSCSMKIFEGTFEAIIARVAEDYRK